MTSMEWLPFISPCVWILLILNGLALIPIPMQFKRLPMTKMTLILSAITLGGWLLALIAFYSNTPVVYRNLVALSEVTLTPTLFLFCAILFCQIYQGKNFLSFLLRKAINALALLFNLLAPIVSFFLHLLSNDKSSDFINHENTVEKWEEWEKQDSIRMNLRGEYMGESDLNKY